VAEINGSNGRHTVPDVDVFQVKMTVTLYILVVALLAGAATVKAQDGMLNSVHTNMPRVSQVHIFSLLQLYLFIYVQHQRKKAQATYIPMKSITTRNAFSGMWYLPHSQLHN